MTAKDLLDKHIQEAYDVQYKYYCMMHTGYRKVEAEVKKLELSVMSGQPSLAKFEKAVRYKREAIEKWREAEFYYKTLKKSRYNQNG